MIEATQAENIDTVILDGRILKRGGVLTALDSEQLIAGASAALEALRDRTRWRQAHLPSEHRRVLDARLGWISARGSVKHVH